MFEFISAALFLFTLRMIDIALDVMRLNMVVRGKKVYAWSLAFIKSIIFLIAIRTVLLGVSNWIMVLGYAAGFATGLLVGMWLEERLAVGYSYIRIISSSRGSKVAKSLRSDGYAVTEMTGSGIDGTVTLLSCNVLRKKSKSVYNIVERIDPEAFITAEPVRSVQSGFWRP